MPRKYWLVAVLAYVLVLGLGLYALLVQRQPPVAEPPEPQPPITENAQSYTIRYKCNHEVTLTPSDGVLGLLSMLNLTEDSIIWEAAIQGSASDYVQLGTVAELCRECQTYMFVGVKDGYVAVYYGLPRPDAELRYVTDILVSRLPPYLQEDLSAGIIIRSEEQLLRFLEGIDS